VKLSKVRAAARRAGWVSLNVAALKDQALIGRFIAEAGAVDLGRARLAFEANRIDEIDESLKELETEAKALNGEGLGLRLGVNKARIEMTRIGMEIASQQISAAHTQKVVDSIPPRMPGFGPFAAPVQVNIANGVPVAPKENSLRTVG
jgi:hypothetical protein